MTFNKLIHSCLLLCFSIAMSGQEKYTLSGYIKDASSGEDLISATLYIPTLEIGSVSNSYGFYSMTIPEGDYEIVFSYIGFKNTNLKVNLTEDQTFDIELAEDSEVLGEVVITAEEEVEDDNVASTEMGVVKMKVDFVKKLPALFGEVDIIRAIQLLPSVKTVGEASSGFYVRGGNADQNLILLDEAPIYNASHLLGFFSSFNPDAIKDMQLYKGSIPAHYGGRLSSVLDIRMKEGNSKHFAASGGLGSIMSRFAVEAPITENGSFMLAGRRSYLDVVANAYLALKNSGDENEEIKNDNAFYFYDLNAKTNFKLNNNNRFFASGYFGRDVFDIKDADLRIQWGNKTGTMRWNHLFSPKLFSNITYYYSNYDYLLDIQEETQIIWKSILEEQSLKADFGAFLNPSNTLKFGLHSIYHTLEPGNISSFDNGEEVQELNLESKKAVESALYISNEQSIGDAIKLDYGLRVSLLQNIGPATVTNLNNDYSIKDTTNHLDGVYNSYWNLEPRLGMRISINDKNSIKASYSRTAQYIQQASNGNSSTPFDIWFLSSSLVKPQLADQVSIGYFKNLKDNTYELSAEIYYKKLTNSIDFKNHASLTLNDNLEAELRIGQGRAYGIEFLAKKDIGRLTGFVGYTYSKTEKNIATINNGNWYNAKYDKPHDFSLVAAYELTDRLTFGGNFVYATGGAVTFPTGRYNFKGVSVPVYSERNGERLPVFHRLDLSATLQSKKNKNRRLQTEWVFSIYNVYNRKNALSIDFLQESGNPSQTFAQKNSVFAIVPSFTFNAKF